MNIKLSPRELKPGIIALEAITTPSGQVLAPAGTELTRQIINRMKLYNVDCATVDSEDPIVKQLLHPTPAPVPVQPMQPMPVVSPVITPVIVPAPVPVATPVAPVRPTPVTEEPKENEKVVTYKEETQSNSRRMMVSNEHSRIYYQHY